MATLARSTRREVPAAAMLRLTVATRSEDRSEQLPSAVDLRAARSLLLAEYGPCAASHEAILIATARRLAAERRSS
jgi:hypothetical protein